MLFPKVEEAMVLWWAKYRISWKSGRTVRIFGMEGKSCQYLSFRTISRHLTPSHTVQHLLAPNARSSHLVAQRSLNLSKSEQLSDMCVAIEEFQFTAAQSLSHENPQIDLDGAVSIPYRTLQLREECAITQPHADCDNLGSLQAG